MRKLATVLLGVVGSLSLGLSSANAQTRLFSEDTPLPIVLEAPFSDLVSTAARRPNAYPAILHLTDAGAAAQSFAIQIRPRGLTRRTAGFCRFPPIRLDFDSNTTRGTVFESQGHLKLVTYCTTPSSSEQRIVLEYLAYRLYNVMTPMSFRVRAAQVTYRDTQHHRAELTRFGFLIEDIDDVAHRNDRIELKLGAAEASLNQISPHDSIRFALFEYMIGNLDWDMIQGPPGDTCCHNSRLIAVHGVTTDVVPVPYDFDYSGFVDAPYAVPPVQIPIGSVRVRYYRGSCRFNSEVDTVVQEFRAHRADLLNVVSSETRLEDHSRTKAARYLGDFFTMLDDPSRVASQLTGHCRG